MLLQPDKGNLWILLVIWVVLFAVLIGATWKSRRPSSGLPLAYAFAFSMIHFYGALIYALPDYQPRHQVLLDAGNSVRTTFLGFEVALIGFSGFVGGWFLANRFVSPSPRLQAQQLRPAIREKLPSFLLTWSLLFFFIFAPIMRLAPSLGSLGNAGTALSIVAACLGCWKALQRKDDKLLLWWVAGSTVCFPLITLVFLGFLGFGVAAACVVWLFAFTFYRRRWVSVLVLLLLVYSGLTLYVNYMRERDSIRESVWGGKQLSSRVEKVVNMFKNFDLLRPDEQYQLEFIDVRLNQNHLVGMAVDHMSHSTVGFAKGATLQVAAIAWIPRILWPGKPITGGSGSLVSVYTGMKFAEGTSVGVGQALEFYINWGYPFAFLGFGVLGYFLRLFDLRAGHYLVSGDYWSFARWFLPAMAMLQPNGSSPEVVGTLAASGVFVYVVHHAYFASYYVKLQVKRKGEDKGALEGAPAPGSPPRYGSRVR